jgi:hypothetical protein
MLSRDDIIRMAREAECEETWGMDAFRFSVEELERFAALVAAQEREACAKVCDARCIADGWEGCYADECAAAIRARGQA